MKTNRGRKLSHGKEVANERFTRGRRRRVHPGLRIFGIAVASALVVLVTTGAIYYNHLLNQIHYEPGGPDLTTRPWPSAVRTTATTRITAIGETTSTTQPTISWAARYDLSDIPVRENAKVDNILLIGWDDFGNADTIILTSIDKKRDTLHMVSILRDTGVRIPGYPHDDLPKINAAYAYGGAPLLIQTIEENFRVKIDHYIAVDFQGFDRIVDSIGGLDLHLTAAEAAHLGLAPGMQHLNGRGVEEYVRIRMIDSDYQRTSRQRYVLELMMDKARGMGALELAGLMERILPQVHTGMSKSELSLYLLAAPAMLRYPLTQDSLPRHGTYESYDYTFHLDLRANVTYLHNLLYGP